MCLESVLLSTHRGFFQVARSDGALFVAIFGITMTTETRFPGFALKPSILCNLLT